MVSSSWLASRLRQARFLSGLTIEAVASAIDTSNTTIWRYEAGQRRPSGPTLHALASVYGRSVDWLLGETDEDGEAPDSTDGPAPDSPDAIVSLDEVSQDLVARIDRLESYVRSAVAESRTEYDAGDDMPAVRPVEVVEVAAAAGGGAEVFDESVIGKLWFRHDWLASNAIDPAQCNVISVRGESMEPTLPDGCSILVDRSQGRKRRRVGRIFVMRTEDGLVVKRAGKDKEGNWQIVSEHPAWETVPWANGTEIIGEVRWAARTFS